MATYKTPGVYVEEITKFPPSVAQVETAIPAFIGYTEKAEKRNGDSLSNVPMRITSLLEYETYFGGAAEEDSITVEISDTVSDNGTERSIKVNQPTTPQPYKMYYSLQFYFANGGGPCYIVSVGNYEDSVVIGTDTTGLKGGLQATRKEDEPTLLLFPDATSMTTESDYWSLMKLSLAQCNDLQDRFAIIDPYNGTDATNMSTDIEALRNGVGSDYLKYGASYYPYLDTILDYNFSEKGINISHISTQPSAVPVAFENLDGYDMSTLVDDLYKIDAGAGTGTLIAARNFIYDYDGATGFDVGGADDFTLAKASSFTGLMDTALEDLGEIVALKDSIEGDANSVIASIEESTIDQDAVQDALDLFLGDFQDAVPATNANKISAVYAELVALNASLKKAKSAEVGGIVTSIIAELDKLVTYTEAAGTYTAGLNNFSNLTANLAGIVTDVDAALGSVVDTNNGELNGRKLSALEAFDNRAYNQIKLEIAAMPITLPPSSAMAGIYARTDANIGVWKAPANTALNYVVEPSVLVSSEEQADLNVTTTGKSVNAIRTFRGKGTLVWGARTLAGNDNEWRYIPVRRFFNMVEESVSKASEQFVFESNDANTWVRIRAMIENFLLLQWKAGALAGSKPEQAFYVRVGLGQTMTAQDILEGRMIIEIGMAAVRPAEFIILRFSHKMQEA